jgi:hypothetical protein
VDCWIKIPTKLSCFHASREPPTSSAIIYGARDRWLLWAPFVIKDCTAKIVINDPELWNFGAHAIYFEDGNVRVKYTRERRGMRPWSAGWKPNAD